MYAQQPQQQQTHMRSPQPLQQQQQGVKVSRLSELLDAVRGEVDAVTTHYKAQRDELEHKLSVHVAELTAFQQTLAELERAAAKNRASYEEEVRVLRRALESRGIPVPEPVTDIGRAAARTRPPSYPEGVGAPVLSGPPLGPGGKPGGLFGAMMEQGAALPQQGSHQQQQQHSHSHQQQHPYQQQQAHTMGQKGHGPPPAVSSAPQQLPPSDHSKKPKHSEAPPSSQVSGTQATHSNGSAPSGKVEEHAPGERIASKSAPPPSRLHTTSKKDGTLTLNPRGELIAKGAQYSVELAHSLDHTSVVCCVKFSLDGAYLATGCNHYAQVYSVSTGQCICSLRDPADTSEGDLYIRTVCFSPDGSLLATGVEDGLIRIWNIQTQTILMVLKGHEQDIYSIDWSRSDLTRIVSGSGDKTVRVWDAKTGQSLKTMNNDADPTLPGNAARDSGVTCVSINPVDGRSIVACSLDEMIRVWDMQTGQLLERFEGHTNSVYSVAFSPNGRSIVSGSLDMTLKVWDLSPATLTYLQRPAGDTSLPSAPIVTKTWKHSFSGHSDFVLSVAYPGKAWASSVLGDDADWIVSASKDKTVTFWNASPKDKKDPTVCAQFTLNGHKNSVISVSVAGNQALFATGSGDQKAKIWKLQKGTVANNTTDRSGLPPQVPHPIVTNATPAPIPAFPNGAPSMTTTKAHSPQESSKKTGFQA